MEQPLDLSRTILTTRVVRAPREKVFRAWTDPAILADWWGPKGFTSTFHTFDLKVGGLWDFTMHGPDGKDYANTSVFRKVEAPALLEFDHLKEMHFYKAITTFADVAGGTRIEWRMRFNTVEELQPIRGFIAAANEENLDRLERILSTQP